MFASAMRSWTLTLVLTLCGQSCFAADQAVPTEKGWELVQLHAVQKRVRVYISARGIRIDSLVHTWSIVSEAPAWDAVVFSRGDKTICRVPYTIWSKNGLGVDEADDLAVIPKVRSVREANIRIGNAAALPVTFVHWEGRAPELEKLIFQSRAKSTNCSFTLVVTRGVNAPTQVLQLIKGFYKVPQFSGITLSLVSSSERRPLLETLEIKPIKLSPEIFELPKNYKLVKNESDVWVNADDKRKVNEFGQLLGAPGN